MVRRQAPNRPGLQHAIRSSLRPARDGSRHDGFRSRRRPREERGRPARCSGNPMQTEPPPPRQVSPVRRVVFVGSGLVCVALGVLGIVIPGLPTTPFLLAASYLFARSSPRLSAWLAGHRWLGPYLRAVRNPS